MAGETLSGTYREGRARKGVGRLARLLEVPVNSVLGGAHIEMNANRELFIEGCRGILEYTDGLIRVAAVDFNIKILGRQLELRQLTPDTMLVEGVILAVEFI